MPQPVTSSIFDLGHPEVRKKGLRPVEKEMQRLGLDQLVGLAMRPWVWSPVLYKPGVCGTGL